MKKSDIKLTLKNKLFLNPRPQVFKKEYHDLFDRIFPNKDSFIEFLDATDHQSRVAHAKDIIIRLCFESNMPPPTILFENLLRMEDDIDHAEVFTNYIGRDHFVHIVNLYMLGIYIFFYMPLLGNNIYEQVKDELEAIEDDSKLIEPNNITYLKYFLRVWKYFVLYHDLAYPIESYFFANKQSQLKKYLEPFMFIDKYLKKDLAIRILNKVVVLNKIITYSTSNKKMLSTVFKVLGKSTLHLLSKDQKPKEIKSIPFYVDKPENYIKIHKINGFESIKYLRSIFPDNEIVGILVDKDTQKIEALSFVNDSARQLVVPDYMPSRGRLYNTLLNEKSLFSDENFTFTGKVWNYYIKDPQDKIKALVKTLMLDSYTIDNEACLIYLNRVNSYLDKVLKSRYYKISSEEEFKNYTFDVYKNLYDITIEMDNNGDIDDISNFENKRILIQINNLVDNFGKDIAKYFESYIKNIGIEKFKDSEKISFLKIEDLIKKVLTIINEDREKIASDLVGKIRDKYETDTDTRTSICYFLSQLEKNTVLRNIKASSVFTKSSIDDFVNSFTDKILPPDYVKNHKNIIEKIDKKLQFYTDGSFSNIIERYRFCKTQTDENKPLNDHGVISAFLYLYVYDSLDTLAQLEDKTVFKLMWNFTSSEDEVIKKHKFINDEILYSIFIHNIYNENYKKVFGKNSFFKTFLNREPIAYLAILADSLQPWDRKRTYKQSLKNIPYEIYSNSFDIHIENNKLNITEFSKYINMSLELEKLKSGLDEYLEHASELIKLNLSEINN